MSIQAYGAHLTWYAGYSRDLVQVIGANALQISGNQQQ